MGIWFRASGCFWACQNERLFWGYRSAERYQPPPPPLPPPKSPKSPRGDFTGTANTPLATTTTTTTTTTYYYLLLLLLLLLLLTTTTTTTTATATTTTATTDTTATAATAATAAIAATAATAAATATATATATAIATAPAPAPAPAAAAAYAAAASNPARGWEQTHGIGASLGSNSEYSFRITTLTEVANDSFLLGKGKPHESCHNRKRPFCKWCLPIRVPCFLTPSVCIVGF